MSDRTLTDSELDCVSGGTPQNQSAASQTQVLQVISTILKNLHDTRTAVIRNIQ